MNIGPEIWITWIVLAGLVGVIGNSRGRGFLGGFLISLVLSPIIGLIAVLVSGDGQKRGPCWQCKERIVVGAVKCSHCGADQVWRRGVSAGA